MPYQFELGVRQTARIEPKEKSREYCAAHPKLSVIGWSRSSGSCWRPQNRSNQRGDEDTRGVAQAYTVEHSSRLEGTSIRATHFGDSSRGGVPGAFRDKAPLAPEYGRTKHKRLAEAGELTTDPEAYPFSLPEPTSQS